MADERRTGDERPSRHDPELSLTMRPAHDQPFRWLPKHGEPSCIGEWLSQRLVKALAYAPIYFSIVSTLTLIVALLIYAKLD